MAIQVSVAFDWVEIGNVKIDDGGKLAFPSLPSKPGLYCFRILNNDHISVYVGETDQLPRRLQHYRTPGPTQQTNIRMNKVLIDALSLGIAVSVSTVTDGITAKRGELDYTIDLAKKSDRVLLEQAAIIDARQIGTKTLNA